MCAETVTMGGSLRLSQHRIVTTTRVDEAADTISRFLLPLRIVKVTEPRYFRLDMNGRRLGRLNIGFIQFAANTELDPGRVEDTVCVSMGCDRRHPSYVELDNERIRVSTRTAAVISHSRHVRIWRPSHSGTFTLGMPASVLADRYEEITGNSTRVPIVFEPTADLRNGPGHPLRELTHALAMELEREGAASENTLLWSVLEDALISVVLGLPNDHSRGLADESRPDFAPFVVRWAEEYMAAHAADAINLSHLIAVCGCSRSALFQAFKSSRGYTPMQFLASRRIEIARERLMQEPGRTVTEIALDSGFGHHGRFAKAYRSRFGESPSVTLAKYQGPMRH